MIDQHDLEDRLSDAFAWRADHTVVETEPRMCAHSTLVEPESRPATRGRVLVTAAAVILAVVATYAVVATRDNGDEVASMPNSSTVATTNADEGGSSEGRLGLDPATGFVVLTAEDWMPSGLLDPQTMEPTFQTRIYATAQADPEAGPALVMIASPGFDGGPEPPTPPGAIDVDVADATGELFDTAGGAKGLQFRSDGLYYQLRSFNLSNAELIAAAESASPSPDGNGAVIDVSTLPDGVSEQFVGWSESVFVSVEASRLVAPRAEFGDPETGATVMYASFADPDLFRLNRLASYTRITDYDVNGAPAFFGSFEDPAFSTVVWRQGLRTFVLTGTGVDETQLLELARALHPVSADEWSVMTNTHVGLGQPCAPVTYTPTTACIAG